MLFPAILNLENFDKVIKNAAFEEASLPARGMLKVAEIIKDIKLLTKLKYKIQSKLEKL